MSTATQPANSSEPRLLRYLHHDKGLAALSPAEYSYKTVFAVLAVANHIWGVASYGWNIHKALTFVGSFANAVAKILSLAELLVTVQLKTLPEHHWSREVVNYFQVLTSVVETLVFVFYWIVLAYFDYTMNEFTKEDHVLNITMHVMCPIIAVTPIFLERTDFGTKQLVGVYVAGFIYLGYMVSYAVRTNKGIYDPLFTFRDVITYVLVAVVLLLILGFFFLLKWVNKKMVEKFLQKNPPTPAQQ